MKKEKTVVTDISDNYDDARKGWYRVEIPGGFEWEGEASDSSDAEKLAQAAKLEREKLTAEDTNGRT